MMRKDPMGVGIRSTPKIRQFTEIQEHTLFFGKWECMRSYDYTRRVGYRDMKDVMQY